MLVPGRGLRRAGAEAMVRLPERLGWKVWADAETVEGMAEIATLVEGAETARRTVTIDDKAVSQTALGRRLQMVWLTPAMDRLWTDPAGERRRFLDRITLGFEPGHADASLAYEKAMRARNRLLREPGWDAAWLSGLEAQMARSGARIARARAVALDALSGAQQEGTAASSESVQNTAQSLFPRAELAILGDMEKRFSQVIRSCGNSEEELDAAEAEEAAGLSRRLQEGRARDAAAGRTLDGPHRSDLEAVYAAKGMPAAACSTGEQKALLISLCLANARALAAHVGAAPILLFDEIAAHLDSARRTALYDEIAALEAQAWMTGTGPELFDGLTGALRIHVTDDEGASILEVA